MRSRGFTGWGFLLLYLVSILTLSSIFRLSTHEIFLPFVSPLVSCWMSVSVQQTVTGRLDQDDTSLVRYIQEHVLLPPDTRTYNLVNPNEKYYSEYKAEDMLDIIFDGKKNGTFFEAGAFNGENISNTLYLEKNRSWRGLLVEASPDNQNEIINKHRKAWLARACISASDQPEKITFVEAGPQGYVEGYYSDLHNNTYKCGTFWMTASELKMNESSFIGPDGTNCTLMKTKDTQIQCFPLYSLLLASGLLSIDFMSLDIQGVEIHALRTLPFDKVDVKVLLVESFATIAEQRELETFLRSKGYNRLTDVLHSYRRTVFPLDVLFIKDGLSIPVR